MRPIADARSVPLARPHVTPRCRPTSAARAMIGLLVALSSAPITSPWMGVSVASAVEPAKAPSSPGTSAAPAAQGPIIVPPRSAAVIDPAWFASAASYSAEHGGRAVLVADARSVLHEAYANGWSASRPHALASGTKSFVGILAMMAVRDGLLTLDEPASRTIEAWQGDPRKARITVRQLLDLSSGLDPADALLGGRGGSRVLGDMAELRSRRLDRQRGGDEPEPRDLFAAALGVSAVAEPGERFAYGPSHFYAFGALLERRLAASDLPTKRVRAYMDRVIFEPLGMRVAWMGRDKAGNPRLPGGCMLTAREWAKFGQFVLRGGTAVAPDGTETRLLDPALLNQCFVPSAANPAYGLTWWLGGSSDAADGARARGVMPRAGGQAVPTIDLPKDREGRPVRVIMAAGLGKQRLYVLPEQGLVVVRYAEATRAGQRFDDSAFLGRLLGLVGEDAPRATP